MSTLLDKLFESEDLFLKITYFPSLDRYKFLRDVLHI